MYKFAFETRYESYLLNSLPGAHHQHRDCAFRYKFNFVSGFHPAGGFATKTAQHLSSGIGPPDEFLSGLTATRFSSTSLSAVVDRKDTTNHAFRLTKQFPVRE
ncbi:hypothetical protein KEM48_003399 [Puccinia striiformis f. sp. tritici PST-130]|nr:hypothetical protein KEM48_003399 [Puccinia striiformis f. sp. tritici PST-130]